MNLEPFKQPFRVLHLEDNEIDHLFVVATLQAEGLKCSFSLAKSKSEFTKALREAEYDLIISDYSLPSYDGLSALSAARELQAQTPFIFFSGTIGEEVAVDSLKLGAVDYILKQRPGRLIAAVRQILHSAEERARLKQSERALGESEERFRIVARTTNDVVWEWDIQNKQVWFSGNFREAFGHEFADTRISPEQWFDFIHPDEKDQVVRSISGLLACGTRIWWSEHRLRRADGSYAYIFDRASVIYDSSGHPQKMVGVKVDMSERKQAEEKIREQAALLDKATDAIIVCALNHEISFWNQGAERIYGWSSAEAVGKNLRKLLFPGELSLPLQEVEKSLKQNREWTGELSEHTKSGKIITVSARNTLIHDQQGQPKAVLIINSDITEHKQLEEQFLRAQRQESLGSLVSGIAHDLNNALVPIIVGVEILAAESLSEDAASMLRTMQSSARRSAEMVKQMLLFARGGESTKSLINPARLLKEMGKIITDTFPKSVNCQINAENDLHPVSAVSTQIHQVLMNLCVNARDAMSGTGTLTLTVGNEHWDEPRAAQLTGARAGDFVYFSVRDTGTGIPPEQLETIFQPFFTTKAPDKGTGLGLSTCLAIVKKHEGFIAVHSKLGTGTEFKVYLPAATIIPAEPAATPKILPPVRKGERIMVIDDEESILAMTRAALTNFGYVVSTAATGMEAITRFRENPAAFELIITDQVMPLLDGQATAAALRKIRPDIKIIMASGGFEAETAENLHNLHVHGFISKPFTAEKLLSVVNETLAGKEA